MQQLQQRAERVGERSAGGIERGRVGIGIREHRLRELEIPIAEFMPSELVERLCDEIQPIRRKAGVHFAHRVMQPRPYPAVCDAEPLLAAAARRPIARARKPSAFQSLLQKR